MKKIEFKYFPGRKAKALTLSYDDGVIHDKRLIEIMNKNNIKGSFHLNSGLFGCGEHLPENEIKDAYQGHEISVHSKTHPFLTKQPKAAIINEIWEDRLKLEEIAGYPVRGMSYPFGAYNDDVIKMLRELGIVCSRTTVATNNFSIPQDFLAWHPTCHHNGNIMEKAKSFKAIPETAYGTPNLFFLWGHSYEFDRQDNWKVIEEFCEFMANDPAIWYATNIEIADYYTALNRLEFSADCSIITNPTSIDICIAADGQPVEIKAGQTLKI